MSDNIFTFYDDSDTEYTVTVSHNPGTPAHISGPPENCYPEDPGDFEILSVVRDSDSVMMDIYWIQKHEEKIEIDFYEEFSPDESDDYRKEWDD